MDGFSTIDINVRREWQSRLDAWYADEASPPTAPDPFAPPKASEPSNFSIICWLIGPLSDSGDTEAGKSGASAGGG